MSIISLLDMKLVLMRKLNPRFWRIKAAVRAINNFYKGE